MKDYREHVSEMRKQYMEKFKCTGVKCPKCDSELVVLKGHTLNTEYEGMPAKYARCPNGHVVTLPMPPGEEVICG